YSDAPGPDDATELLARLPLHSIVFAFTTSSYLLGTSGEQALTSRLEKRSRGIPVLLPCVAAAAAFRALGARRIALVHPPWFTDNVVKKGSAYFQSLGFEVLHASHLEPAIDPALVAQLGEGKRREITEVNPADIYEWVRTHAPANMEAAFIAGNGFRTIGVITALEEDLGRPILTANQAAFWYALRLAGAGAEVDDYGRIFRQRLNVK